jgi:hypothetical protein
MAMKWWTCAVLAAALVGGAAMTRAEVRATRFLENPLIRQSLPSSIGDNVNGPTVIRVPRWVERPLGRYYMYFAHHGGQFIRLAYADSVRGPWKVHTWRKKYGGLEVSEARRLKTLEAENAKLKKLLAESMMDVSTLREMRGKNF